MLGADHDDCLCGSALTIAPNCSQLCGDRFQNRLAGSRVVLADSAGRLTCKEADRALIRPEPELHVQGLPWAVFFVFSYAEGELPRVAQRRHIDLAWPGASKIDQDQLKRSSDSAVGARYVAEHIASACEAELASNRAVYDHQRSGEVSGRLNTVNIETLVANRSQQRNQHPHHLGNAPCHHGVRGDLLDCGGSVVWRYSSYHFIRSKLRVTQHSLDPFERGRDYRQRIIELLSAILIRIDGIFQNDSRGSCGSGRVQIERVRGFAFPHPLEMARDAAHLPFRRAVERFRNDKWIDTTHPREIRGNGVEVAFIEAALCSSDHAIRS